MRKAGTIFLLIVSLLWHTFAIAYNGLAYDHAEGLAHLALHLENEPHHHHDDGSFHQDQSDESVQHVYADGLANAVGVLPIQSTSGFADAGSAAHSAAVQPARDSPILEGPRRPPRLTA